MNISRSDKFNQNYACKIVELNKFRPHCNPEVTRLKVARVDEFDIIVGIDTEKGLYIYFPVGCAIDPEFLKLNNLYTQKNIYVKIRNQQSLRYCFVIIILKEIQF